MLMNKFWPPWDPLKRDPKAYIQSSCSSHSAENHLFAKEQRPSSLLATLALLCLKLLQNLAWIQHSLRRLTVVRKGLPAEIFQSPSIHFAIEP